MKRAIQIPGAPAPIGPYSQAILKGDTLFISGQIPLDPKTGELIDKDIASSTTQILDNITALLREAGMTLEQVVKCSIFMTDLNQFSEMNMVYGSYFVTNPPARETVQVSRLPMNVSIEISCIAMR